MKVTFKPIPNGPLTFDIEATDDVTLFERLAHVQALFGDTHCGCCGKTNLQFRVRQAKNNKNQTFSYFERVCMDCNAKLDYGQNREGRTLFAKRTIEVDGRNVYDKEHEGWYVWEPPQAMPQAMPRPMQLAVAPNPVQRPTASVQGDAYEGADFPQNEEVPF